MVATPVLGGVTAGMICIIVGLAVSSPVCAIVAGVISVGAAYIDWLNKMWGKGIYIEAMARTKVGLASVVGNQTQLTLMLLLILSWGSIALIIKK